MSRGLTQTTGMHIGNKNRRIVVSNRNHVIPFENSFSILIILSVVASNQRYTLI